MRFATELGWADREIARVRADLIKADAAEISSSVDVREMAATSKAAAYVWLAAILERIVRDSLQTTLREISVARRPFKEVRLSLFALACDAEFQSIADRSRGNSWQQRINAFLKTVDGSNATFSEEVLPTDGRTIRGEHFDIIWLVFGLVTPSLPTPLHRIALKDLADGRNLVAHGHEDRVTFGRKKASADLIRLSTQVDEIITHYLASLDSYVGLNAFLR